MEKRVLLAIVLTTAVVVIFNVLFPPSQPPAGSDSGADTAAVDTAAARDTAAEPAGRAPSGLAPGREAADTAGEEEATEETGRRADGGRQEQEEPSLFGPRRPESGGADTVRVRTPLLDLAFSTRGGALVGAELQRYASFAENGAGEDLVQLVREGDRLLDWKITAGGDTLDLTSRELVPSATELTLEEGDSVRALTFRDSLPEFSGLSFRVTYRFHPDDYRITVGGGLEGERSRGYGYTAITSLGVGLQTNEKEPEEDFDQLAYAVRTQGGDIHRKKLDEVEQDATETPEGGPFTWVAVKNKYFVAGLLSPEGRDGAFGGFLVTGLQEDHAARMAASLPVPSDREGFGLVAYMGPQERDRLAQAGPDFQSVNPIGYDWLRFIIRPLADLVTTVLTWLHTTFSLAYGWVLILFGIMVRVVLFPLYQKSMRAQMQQMQVQPVIQELQDKYEDDPQKLQQEMMRVYREHNLNPLAGCLPMLLPFPILITLFFVFRSTIEFRGVPFLWLPDLSLADPLYIIPVLMGLSMFLLQWIGQRGMERNLQMKLMSYGMPVVFTLLFLRFPAGLNLYYATSNLASLPQQFYLSHERKKMKQGGGGGGG